MTEEKKSWWKKWWWVVFFGLLVIFLTLAFNHVLHWFTGLEMPGSQGEFGDQFGVLNTLISGFAFLGMLIALGLQREDLQLQREELARQREEMRNQTKELRQQELSGMIFSYYAAVMQALPPEDEIALLYKRIGSFIINLAIK